MPEEPKCPYCDGPTRLLSRKGGGQFWSCVRFPHCRGAVSISPDNKPGSAPGPEVNPKFRADGALALAVALIPELDKLKEGQTIASVAVQMIDELIMELQK